MASPIRPLPPLERRPIKRASRFRPVLKTFLLLALGAGLLWLGRHAWRDVDSRIRTMEQKVEALDAHVAQYARDLAQARDQASVAGKRASEAEQKSKELETAKQRSEADAERARVETNQALSEKQQAREELARIRQKREEELDRMQAALNRVARTRRTSSGMVIDLTNDSFRFDFDKADLRPENRELLSRIAGVLLASNGYSLYIYGHTDDIGTTEYNQRLSERRAQSVRDYLLQAGIPGEIMGAKGFGKSSPRVQEKTPAAREKNRRVEIGIVDTIIDYQHPAAK